MSSFGVRSKVATWASACTLRRATLRWVRSARTDASASNDVALKTASGNAGHQLPFLTVGTLGIIGSAGLLYVYQQQPDQAEAAETATPEIPAATVAASAAEAAAKAAAEAAAQKRAAEEAAAAKDAETRAAQQMALARLQRALAEATGLDPSDEAVEELRAAAHALSVEVPAEMSAEAIAGIAEARARFVTIKTVKHARRTLAGAQAALEEAFQAKDALVCQSVLRDMADAEWSLNEDADVDARLLGRARAFIDEFQRAEREAKLRTEAIAKLERAVASRQAEQCAVALADSKEVGVAPCPATELARVLAEPEQLHGVLVDLSVEGPAGPCSKQGLTVEDFASAAAYAASSMDENQLQQQVAELTAAVISNHVLQVKKFEKCLQVAEAKLFDLHCERAEGALRHFRLEKEQAGRDTKSAMEATWRIQTQEATSAAATCIREELEAQRASLYWSAEQSVEMHICQDREGTHARISAFAAPLMALEEAVTSGQGLEQCSRATGALSGSLLALQAALVEGRPLGRELAVLQEVGSAADAFIPRLLAQVPAETMTRSCGPVPTEQQLVRSFRDQLGSLTEAVFAPPPVGLLGSLGSRFTGRLLGSAYVLKAAECPPPAEESPQRAAQQNLAALARASALVERGELRAALGVLEDLTGACRVRIRGWAQEARHALLLKQAAQATQAKVRCLDAALP